MSEPTQSKGPRISWPVRLLLAFLLSAGGAVGLGLALGPKEALGSVGALLVLVLLWPVVLVALSLVIGLVLGLFGESAGGVEDVADVGLRRGLRFYRRLLRLRSPVLWGLILGSLAGAGGLAGYVKLAILDREEAARTQLEALVATLRAETGVRQALPEAEHAPLHEALGLEEVASWRGHPLVDPWGRPVRYSRWKGLVSEHIAVRSDGWNGLPEEAGDDIAVEEKLLPAGVEKAGSLLDKAAGFLKDRADQSSDG